MKRLLILLSLSFTIFHLSSSSIAAQNIVTDEGAWCWFADPRALHYENAAGTINATYLGYIDVHGNVKATQYDWLAKRKTLYDLQGHHVTTPATRGIYLRDHRKYIK